MAKRKGPPELYVFIDAIDAWRHRMTEAIVGHPIVDKPEWWDNDLAEKIEALSNAGRIVTAISQTCNVSEATVKRYRDILAAEDRIKLTRRRKKP